MLCCRVHTRTAATAWVSALPVSIEQWGRFVRTREYFNAAHWHSPPHRARGADEVLARIGYRWPIRHRPVGSITWGEARAYCSSVGGRLPWLEEWRLVDDAVGRLDAIQVSGLKVWLPADGCENFWPGTGGEWCADAYNAAAAGPAIRAERPLRRRITTHPYRLVPDFPQPPAWISRRLRERARSLQHRRCRVAPR